MSLPALIGFAGVLVAAVATGMLAGRCARQPRIDSILAASATFALTVALAAQSIGFARGFGPATFRAVELSGLMLAPLWLAWSLAELTWVSEAARFGARLIGSAVTAVGGVILVTDPLTAQAFGRSWPLAGPHYQPISDYVLDLVQALAVIVASVSAGLAAARARNDRRWLGALPGIAAVGLAVLVTAGLRFGWPARSVYPLLSMTAAVLVWFGVTRIEDPPGRRAGQGRRAGLGSRGGRGPGAGQRRRAGQADGRYDGADRYDGTDRYDGADPYYAVGSHYGTSAYYGAGSYYGADDYYFPDARHPADGHSAPAGLRGPAPGGPRTSPAPGGPGVQGRWPDPGVRQRTPPRQDRYPGRAGPAGLGPDGRSLAPRETPPAQPPAAAVTATGAGAEPDPQPEPTGPPAAAPARPYGRILIFTLLEDRVADFDRLAEQTAEEVRTGEPDTVVYVIHMVPNAPMQRIFYEIYRDRAAFDSHESQPYVQRFVEERRPCVLATNVIELRLKYAKVAPLPSSQQPSPAAPLSGPPARPRYAQPGAAQPGAAQPGARRPGAAPPRAAPPGAGQSAARAQLPPGQTQGARRPQALEPLPPAPDRRLPPAGGRYGGI